MKPPALHKSSSAQSPNRRNFWIICETFKFSMFFTHWVCKAIKHLKVINIFQGRRSDTHAPAIADTAQIKIGKFSVVKTGQWAGSFSQADAVLPDMQVHIVGNCVGICVSKHTTALSQQIAIHRKGTQRFNYYDHLAH